MDGKNARPIKVLLPGTLIDRADQALQQGLGGFRTRHSLFREAIEYYLLELEELQAQLPLTEESPLPAQDKSAGNAQAARPASHGTSKTMDNDALEKQTPPSSAAVSRNDDLKKFLTTAESLEDMAISGANASPSIEGKLNVSRPARGPILGLHNRDWPTLQAMDQLADMTVTGTVPRDDFYNVATANGWLLSGALAAYEGKGGGKLSALLPSNRVKAKAAESNYRSFALGWISQRAEGDSVATSGPLFAWSCAGLTWRDNELHIGLTDSGAELLRGVAGLIPSIPHETHYTRFFLNHIAQYGEDDWLFLSSLLSDIANRPTRKELMENVRQKQNSSESVAASLVQGYVSRGREWGLIEPRQVDGQYVLSGFGEEWLSDDGKKTNTTRQWKASS